MRAGCTVPTYVWWIVSGACLGMSFVTSWMWPLFIPGLWLFLHVWQKVHSLRAVFWGTFMVGTLKAAGATVWFWSTYPIEWIPIDPGLAQLALIGTYWLLNALALGIGFALVLLIWRAVSGRTFWSFAALPLIFVLAEVAGAFTYSIVTYGPGSYLSINYSFGHIGYLLADFTFLDALIKAGGVYALSIFSVWIVTSAFLYFTMRHQSVYVYLAAGVFCLGGLYIAAFASDDTRLLEDTPTILTIDTTFKNPLYLNEFEIKERHRELRSLVSTAIKAQPDIILLPEGSQLSYGFSSTLEALAWLTIEASSSPLYVIDSGPVKTPTGQTVLRAFIYDTAAQSVYVVDKQYLVPQGEYLPYLLRALIPFIASDEFVASLFDTINSVPGPKTSYESLPETIPPILFCFESVAPRGVRTLLEQRQSQVVLHPVSHAWFHDAASHQLALRRMLRVQAVWNGVIIIEAGNMTTGSVYNGLQ